MKRFVLLLAITCLLVGSGYLYIGYRVTDPFSIDFSAMTSENLPTAMIGSKQSNSFRLVNTSNKSIELLDIKLDGYDGIKIFPITTTGRTAKNLIVPSHRIENTNGWSTNSQGINFDYEVVINNSRIKNPKMAIIIYQYMGIKRQQSVQMPGIQG